MRVLRCEDCGFLDASVPTTAEDGDRCTNCQSTATVGTILRTL